MVGRVSKIIIYLCFLVAISTIVVNAQESELSCYDGHSVDVKIYFPYDESHIDPNYMDNHYSLSVVDSLLRDVAYISTIHKIDISAQSSPEGRADYNEQLSQRRIESLEEYFTTNYPQIDSALWSFNATSENWELFHLHLVEDPNLPCREEVIYISEEDRDPDQKEWLLKNVEGGRAWQYIKEHILPSQRFGASVLFIPISYPSMAQEIPIESNLTIPPIEPLSIPIINDNVEQNLLFALKTNLLLDVVSVINIGVEIPLKKRWSIVGEVVYPWWRSWDHNFTMQIESYHAELKYWLGDRDAQEQLQGWSVGLYGGFGLYDIQLFSEEGVQGDFFDVGAQLSYSHPISKSKSLYLEYALGLGYISTDYNDYYMAYDTEEYGDIKVIPYPWMNSKLRSVLPTRLGVSLVWHISSKAKGGAR